MSEDLIRYDILAQEALRGVVRKVLSEVAKAGLPGEHHFFISFMTRAPGVRISQRLLDQYDKEMTIVLQNQFWDMKVTETGFEVGLSFDGNREMLSVPFSALKGFFDPSVQFGLQFDVERAGDSSDDAEAEPDSKSEAKSSPAKIGTAKAATDADSDAPPADDAEKVVSLDSFRKKP